MITPQLFRQATADALAADVNAFLAPFFGGASQRVIGASLDVKANVPFYNGNLYLDITLDNTNAISQSAPFVFKVRSEEHTSELQSRHCISYAVFCL